MDSEHQRSDCTVWSWSPLSTKASCVNISKERVMRTAQIINTSARNICWTYHRTSMLNSFWRFPRYSPIICLLSPFLVIKNRATVSGNSLIKPCSHKNCIPFSGFLKEQRNKAFNLTTSDSPLPHNPSVEGFRKHWTLPGQKRKHWYSEFSPFPVILSTLSKNKRTIMVLYRSFETTKQ